MKKFTLLFFIFCLGFFEIKAQTPELINYQAVARDVATGLPKINQTGSVRMTIRNSVGGTVLYQETHSGVTTNQFGLFTVKIGGGTPVTGTFANINWSTGNKFLEVEVDYGSGYENMGTTQLVSVPYALYAKEALNGPAGKNSLMNITAIGNGATCPNGGYQVDVGTDVDGSGILDASEITGTFTVCNGDSGQSGAGINWLGTFATAPSNPNVNDAYYNSALGQSLIWDGTTWQIMAQDGSSGLTGGTGITIVGGVVNNTGDLDSLDDKINSAVLNGSTIEITEGSTLWSVNLSSLINTNDTSATNELQTISLSGNTITLSNGGGTINLSSLNTDNQNLINGGKSGNLQTINIQNGTGVTFSVADGDSLSNNEIQTLSFSNPTLTLSLGGGSVNLSSLNTDNQTLNFASPNLSISGGNTVNLSGLYTAGSGISISSGIITNTAPDQTVTLTGSGATSVSGSYPNFTISSTDNVNDADADPTNEYNTSFTVNAGNLELTDGGGTLSVPITNLADSDWLVSGSNIYNGNSGNVGIGTSNPQTTLHVLSNDTTGIIIEGNNAFGTFNFIQNNNNGSAGELYISGTDTVFHSLEPLKSTYFIGYKGNKKIQIESDTVMFVTNNKIRTYNKGNFFNDDTLFTNELFVLNSASNIGDVLTNLGGGRAVWQPLPGGSNLWVPNGNDMYNSNTGNIGIGTTSPLQKLHVNNGTLRVSDATNYIDISQNGTTTDFILSNPLDIYANGGSVSFSMDDGDAYFYINAHVIGQFQLSNGSEANGRILVSDATGVGTWTDPSTIPLGSAWLYNGTDIYNGNSGKVGVGISTPNALFHVQDVSSTGGDDLVNVGDFLGNPLFTVLDVGNVGIGLAAPVSKLDVYTTNNERAGQFNSNFSSTNDKFGVYALAQGGGTGENIGLQGEAVNATTNKAIVGRAFGGTNNWAGYFELGNVYVADNLGIGTLNVINKLDVEGGIAIGTNYSGNFAAPTDGAIIEGSVGIGTASPAHKLHVVNSTLPRTGYFENNYTSGTTFGIYAGAYGVGTSDKRGGSFEAIGSSTNTNTGVRGWAQDGTNANYGGQFYANGSSGTNYGVYGYAAGATNNWSGYFASGDVYVADNVGIGTTTPTTTLHVNHPTGTTNGLSISNASDADKWHFYMYTTNDLTLYFNGAQRGAFDDVSGNYTATSDLRLKKNINSVSSVLDDVMKLNFVEYNYKGQKDNRKYFGFIAQEVEKVFPSLVYYQEESDLYLMDYSGFGSIAIKAIQEQQKMIDKQQQMIEELKKEIEALKNQK